MTPPDNPGSTAEIPGPVSRRAARSRLRRRLGAVVRLVAALALVGGIYTGFAPGAGADDTKPVSEADAAKGKELFDNYCISCHAPNAQGVPGKGPSLIGVGSAAVEFQVTSGRMPAARQEAQAERKRPYWEGEELDKNAKLLGAYIESLGGGPQLPDDVEGNAARGDIAHGGELFRVNCAACHQFAAAGGALSSGKFAPPLGPATERQIYAAMLTGPQSMPVFGDNQLTPREKYDVIAYVQNLKTDQDPGGWGLGHYGPVPEGLVIFLVGIVGLVFATIWIAGKS